MTDGPNKDNKGDAEDAPDLPQEGGKKVPLGRVNRLRKVAGMTARLGRDALTHRVKRMLGGEGDPRLGTARKVLETLGEMKGAALKVGQTISLGAGQLPPEVRQVVSKLFSEAPALDYASIAQQVEAELGGPPEDIFASFEREPFAAASLGQVHLATLTTGEQVVVKVQYPDVEEALDDDLRNAAAVVRGLGLGTNLLDGRDYLNELRAEVHAELDYKRELRLLESFREYLAPWKDIAVPKAYPDYCTTRVLVLELLRGPTLHAYCQDVTRHSAEERFKIASQLVRALYGPFFQHKVIHGDAHPGNFIVMGDGRLGVLDFGSIKFLSDQFWRCYREASERTLSGEPIEFVELLRSGGFTITLPEERAEPLLQKIATIASRPMVGEYDFGEDTVVEELRELGMRRAADLLRIRPPAEALLFYRAGAGLTYNLRHLKAKGDWRPVFEQLL